MEPSIVPINPTYDSYWRSIAHELFFRHSGISTGFGCAQAFDPEKTGEKDSPFQCHGSPEHAVQLILARWLRFYAAYKDTSWTQGPKTLVEDKRVLWTEKQGALWAALGAGKRRSSKTDTTAEDEKPLPLGSIQTLVRFLTRWYGALMACVYSRETVQGIHVKESLIESLVRMVHPLLKPPAWIRQLPEWKLMDPIHETIPVADIAAATTRLLQIRVIVLREGKDDRAVPLQAPASTHTLPPHWKQSPPALDTRFYTTTKGDAHNPVLGSIHVPDLTKMDIPAYEDTIVCVRGFLPTNAPTFIALRQTIPQGHWWSRPASSILISSIIDVLRKGFQGPAPDQERTVASAMHLVLPFLDQETADTLLLQRLTKHKTKPGTPDEGQSLIGSTATGASDATIKYKHDASKDEEDLLVTPSWFPAKIARIEGLRRRTFSFTVPIRPNFGRGVQIVTELMLNPTHAWLPPMQHTIKRLAHLFQTIDLQETPQGLTLAFRSQGGVPWHQAFILHTPSASTRVSQTSRALMKLSDPVVVVDEEDQGHKYHSLTQTIYETFTFPITLLHTLLLAPPASEDTQSALKALQTLATSAISYDTRLGVDHLSDVFVAWILASRRKLIRFDEDDSDITLLCPVLEHTHSAIETLLFFFSKHGTKPHHIQALQTTSLRGFRIPDKEDPKGTWGCVQTSETVSVDDVDAFVNAFHLRSLSQRSPKEKPAEGSAFTIVQDLGLRLQKTDKVFVAKSEKETESVPVSLSQRVGWNPVLHGLVLSPFQIQIVDQFAPKDLITLLLQLVDECDTCPRELNRYLKFKKNRLDVRDAQPSKNKDT